MKRTVSLLLALALLCSPASAAGAPDISAGSAILIHADSGETLFERKRRRAAAYCQHDKDYDRPGRA